MNTTVKTVLIAAGALVAVALLGIFFCYRIAVFPRIACRKAARSMDKEVRYAVPTSRCNIYDANGNIIATSEEVYDVNLDCAIIQDDAEWREKTLDIAPQLAALFPERGASEWWDYLQAGRKNNKRYLRIAKGIAPARKDSLARLPIFNEKALEGGAIYESRQVRVYPYDHLARRTIGYTRPAGERTIGIEGKWNDSLHNMDLHTTLSMQIQSAADSALRAVLNAEEDLESGCLILMEVHTGAIRAMVNLSKGQRGFSSGKAWERYNYAIASLYEPGEVLQTMTLVSVLRDGCIHSLDETLPTNHGILPDYPRDVKLLDYEWSSGKDCITVKEGLAQSSKYVFGKLATDYYSDGQVYYTEGIRAWCLPTGFNFDILGFQNVNITNPEGLYWKKSTLPSVANGHALVMTPLDILSFYNTIANRGNMVQPYLVESLRRGKDTYYQHMTNILKDNAIAPAVADTLVKALSYVTTDGTGVMLQDAKVPVAGKTGTARQILNTYDEHGLVDDPYHDNEGRKKIAATYAGFFPAEEPQYSIICVLYSYPTRKTFYGGMYAGRVVKDFVNKLDFN